MEQDKPLQKPAKLPAHCWPTVGTYLAFDKEDREIDAQGLIDAFTTPKPGLLKRIIRRRSA